MAFNRQSLLALASTGVRETKSLDFKREFDVGSNEAWCELIKDIVAFANSGGGVVVFGAENDGAASNIDCSQVLGSDIADITNKIFKYTGHQFAEVEVVQVERAGTGTKLPAMVIAPSDVPMIFVKPGTYDIGDGKQKTAFGQGTLYFRHGGKSEPGNRADLARWRDQELARHRRSLLRGMRKVVEAPPDHSVVVVPANAISSAAEAHVSARITTDPSATKVTVHNTDEIWPHRQKEFLELMNQRMPKGVRLSGYDLQCVNKKIDVLISHPDFAHKPHKKASPQYSDGYAEWLINRVAADPHFVEACRDAYRVKSAS